MKLPRRSLIVLVVIAASIAALFYGPVEDQWRCRLGIGDYVGHSGFEVELTSGQQQEVVASMLDFAQDHDLLFATTLLESPSEERPHQIRVIDSCNRFANFHVANVFSPNRVRFSISRNSSKDGSDFNRLYQAFSIRFRGAAPPEGEP